MMIIAMSRQLIALWGLTAPAQPQKHAKQYRPTVLVVRFLSAELAGPSVHCWCMRRPEVEAWVHRVLDALVDDRSVEDLLVELKSDWPTDFGKAARRVAGHANSAAAQPILWVIGADEKAKAIRGASALDTAKWYAQLKAEFADGWAPAMQLYNIPRDGTVVAAVIFETDGVPFVVKGPQGRDEIPWRDSTGTRSARRSEMFSMLAEQARLPDFQILFAEVTCHPTARDTWSWEGGMDLYIAPRDHRVVTFPMHQMEAWSQEPGGSDRVDFQRMFFRDSVTRRSDSGDFKPVHPIAVDSIQVTVAGPGLIVMQAKSDGPLQETAKVLPRDFHLVLVPAAGQMAVGLVATLEPVAPKSANSFTWRFDSGKHRSG